MNKEDFLKRNELTPEEPKVTYGGNFWEPVEWSEDIGEIAAGISPDENADGWFKNGEAIHRCIKNGTPILFFDKEFWHWKED